MNYDLSPPVPAEGFSTPEVPSFVHEIPGSVAGNPYERFNFWVPERIGEAGRDYATGQRHFETALAFARLGRASNFIASIVGGMCDVGCGPIERGFIDLLSSKATYGRVPDPVSEAMAGHVTRLCGHSEKEVRFGETEATEYLKIARECQCPDVIRDFMIDIVNREFGYGSLTFMWTVCGAAYLGAAN